MAEYLSPGVYVEEFDSGVKAMEGVGTSTGGFIGMAERGPVDGKPVLVTSFADYQRVFGGYLPETPYGERRFLPYAVDRFFANGGSSCYVMRVKPDGAAAASGTATICLGEEPQADDNPVQTIQLTFAARDIGAAGNSLSVTLETAPKSRSAVLEQQDNGAKLRLKNASQFAEGDAVTFGCTIVGSDQKETPVVADAIVAAKSGDWITLKEPLTYQVMNGAEWVDTPLPAGKLVDTAAVPKLALNALGYRATVQADGEQEVYENVSLSASSDRWLPEVLKASKWIAASAANKTIKKKELPQGAVWLTAVVGGSPLVQFLSGGSDGTPATTAVSAYTGTDGGPGKRTGLRAFLEINDVNIMAMPGITDQGTLLEMVSQCENSGGCFTVLDCPSGAVSVDDLATYREAFDSSYAALYHPWLQFFDPLLKANRYFPPSGALAGVYARVDHTRGVHKAPANETVTGCTGLQVTYNEAEQAKLNPKGVNLIRALPGQGIRVWGARTLSSDGNWKYINVRRLFIFLESSIKANTSWVVFEPNDQTLWSRVESTIRAFLTTQWRNGALTGGSPDEAFYVNVGTSTMTQDDILNGRLICEIGVAPVRPAEFVIFRITQKMEEA